MIEYMEQDATLFDNGLPIYLEHDFEVMNSGMLYLKSTLIVGDYDEFALDNSEINYHEMYAIANELELEAAKLRDVAQRIEDSGENVADLFDVVYDPD